MYIKGAPSLNKLIKIIQIVTFTSKPISFWGHDIIWQWMGNLIYECLYVGCCYTISALNSLKILDKWHLSSLLKWMANLIYECLYVGCYHIISALNSLKILDKWHLSSLLKCHLHCVYNKIYHWISNLSRTLEDNKIVDHSDVVGALPVGTAPTTSSFST